MIQLEPRQQVEALRRQEQLIVEARSAGAGIEQRRVQTALLRQTRRELETARRAERAVELGWEPFQPSPEWFSGWLDDPRFLRGRTRLASMAIALPLAASAGLLLAQRWDALAAVLLALVLLLGVQVVAHELLGRVAEARDRALIDRGHEPRLFNAPLPAHAARAYRRSQECGLFESFSVHSPRAEDFRLLGASEAPSVGLLDPVLIGHVGVWTFLVARWDLAQDLASL